MWVACSFVSFFFGEEMKRNPFTEITTLSEVVNGIKLKIEIKSLCYSDVCEVGEEFVALAIAAHNGGGTLNAPAAINKILSLASEITMEDGERVELGDMPVEVIGKMMNGFVIANFTPSKLQPWIDLYAMIRPHLSKMQQTPALNA